jgi:hypothetical protein
LARGDCLLGSVSVGRKEASPPNNHSFISHLRNTFTTREEEEEREKEGGEMPLGIQRLNAKKSQPNDRIIFIKPLKGADEAVARDFLEQIAAQCCEFFL